MAERLFLALWPPAEIVEALAALPRPAEAGVRWVEPDHWHITLRFFGEAEPVAVGAAIDALVEAPIAGAPIADTPIDDRAVEVVLGPKVSRLGRAVVCLPARGLDELARRIAAATGDLGQPPDPRPFAGHLTLARLRHRAACGLAGAPFSARFPATELTLVASRRGPTGLRYDVIARWPLPLPAGSPGRADQAR